MRPGRAGWRAPSGVAPHGSRSAGFVRSTDGRFFGSTGEHHGIYRDVPGLAPDADIRVSSETAPADVEVSTEPTGTRLRIGDPSQTVTGEHRYRVQYPLDGLAAAERLDWDAVGTGWEVDVDQAEVHLVAPFELTDVGCSIGVEGSTTPCTVDQVEPGHVVATIYDLPTGQGLSLEIGLGEALAEAPEPPAPGDASGGGGGGVLDRFWWFMGAVMFLPFFLVLAVVGALTGRGSGRRHGGGWSAGSFGGGSFGGGSSSGGSVGGGGGGGGGGSW